MTPRKSPQRTVELARALSTRSRPPSSTVRCWPFGSLFTSSRHSWRSHGWNSTSGRSSVSTSNRSTGLLAGRAGEN